MLTAIIPAKSVSSRIPGKNIIDLAGKPLFEWTFDICKKWPRITKVVVATDIPEIEAQCVKGNYEMFPLSKEDLSDCRTVRQLWQDIANEFDGDHILLQLTSPFRLLQELDAAFEMYYQQNACDVVVSVRCEHDVRVDRFGKSPQIHKASDACRTPSCNNMTQLSQNREPHYYITGTFWISNAGYVKNCEDLQEGIVKIFPVHPISVIDVNTPNDLEMARTVAQGLLKER